MMVRKTVSGLVAAGFMIGAITLASHAAEKKTKGMAAPHASALAQMTKFAMPGEFHGYLKPLAGSWDIGVRAWTAADQMEVSQGHCETAWVMGERYLKEECTTSGDGRPFQGMGLVGYDNLSKKYVSTWIDTMGTGIMVSEGAIDPAHRTITYSTTTSDPMTGKAHKVRVVSRILDDQSRILTFYATRGGKDAREMEITYTRTR